MREFWYADGYLLTNCFVRDISYESAIYSTPARRGDNSAIAQRNGTIWRPKQYEAGSFTLNMWTYSSAGQEVALDQYRELMRVISRQDALVEFRRVWKENEASTAVSRDYHCYGELLQSVQPTFATARGFRMGMEISIPNAFWESTSARTESSASGPALPKTLSLIAHRDATAPMDDFAYTVAGPITNPSVEVIRPDALYVEKWTYNGTISDGQTLTVDSGTWDVTATGGHIVNQAALDYTGSRYLTVQPVRPDATNPQVRLNGSGGGADTRLTVTGRTKMLA